VKGVKGAKGGFEVQYTDAARDDLIRLFDHLLGRAQSIEDFDAAQGVIDALVDEVDRHLSRKPFIFRKAAASPFLRELLVPFGASGYVALYEIASASMVNILAVRHQLEEDYH
jgi:plasmid stabilization system protein ParE